MNILIGSVLLPLPSPFLTVSSDIKSVCKFVDVFGLFNFLFVSLQITNWLQCLFIFALVWSIGGTINGDSRKKFDAFFRLLISGTDKDHPKPNNIKMTKVQQLFTSRLFEGDHFTYL